MTTARAYQVALETLGTPAPKAKASQLALETLAAPTSKAHASQLAVEALSRSGLGANWLGDTPARVAQILFEAVGAPTPNAQAAQLALESLSRSGDGANWAGDGAARVETCALEALSRSGLGREPPIDRHAAVLETLVLEVVSFGTPGDPCDCDPAPALPTPKYLMRRPRRFA